jgi:hypothetical protein
MDYLKMFIAPEDIFILNGTDDEDLIQAGFEPDGEGLWKRDDGIVYARGDTGMDKYDFQRGNVTISVNCYLGHRPYCIATVGLGDGSTIEISDNGNRKYGITLRCEDTTYIHFYRRDVMTINAPFEDIDGTILRQEKRIKDGVVVYCITWKEWHYHCRSGPAIIRGAKEYYYLNAVKMTGATWEKKRFEYN